MKIHKKLPLFIYAGCGFSLILVIMVGATSLYFSDRQKQQEYWIAHTYQVLEKVHRVHHHLFEMTLDEQRYRLTSESSFLQLQAKHRDSLLSELNLLNGLAYDNPKQIGQVKLLRQEIGGLLIFWKNKNTAIKNHSLPSALQITLAEKVKIDSIRLRILSISHAEHILLKQGEGGSNWLRTRTDWTIITGTLLILVLVCLLIYLILQELKNRINAYQQEKELNMLKSNFVSLASHEFRTPLSSILLSVSLIEKYIKAYDVEKVLKHSEKVKASVNNLTGILEDFLSLEKLSTGRTIVVLEPFDLPALCEDIIEDLQVTASPTQILRFENKGNGQIANLDKRLVRNAIVNLITNSIKYAGEKATIVLETGIAGNSVVIEVKDNGIGIAEKYQKDIFTPFFRVNNNGNVSGTGLGLSIVLRYVKLMNGHISFSSTPHKSTSFGMSFPIK